MGHLIYLTLCWIVAAVLVDFSRRRRRLIPLKAESPNRNPFRDLHRPVLEILNLVNKTRQWSFGEINQDHSRVTFHLDKIALPLPRQPAPVALSDFFKIESLAIQPDSVRPLSLLFTLAK